MSDSQNEDFSREDAEVAAEETRALTLAAGDAPEGVVVILYMRPDRVFSGFAPPEVDEAAIRPRVNKSYRTSSWFFASDFLERMIEAASRNCHGLKVRPTTVEVTFTLDERAYRNVGTIIESFDDAFRGL